MIYNAQNKYETKIKVENFIKRFNKSEDVEDIFLNGCCYWFAYILASRFENSEIMYDEVKNHFATKIDGLIYDISGDVTYDNRYNWTKWSSMDNDDPHKYRIIRDCILF